MIFCQFPVFNANHFTLYQESVSSWVHVAKQAVIQFAGVCTVLREARALQVILVAIVKVWSVPRLHAIAAHVLHVA